MERKSQRQIERKQQLETDGVNEGFLGAPTRVTHLELHHGLLHALHVEDHADELLHRFGELRLGAAAGCQLLHRFLILIRKSERIVNLKHKTRTRFHTPSNVPTRVMAQDEVRK